MYTFWEDRHTCREQMTHVLTMHAHMQGAYDAHTDQTYRCIADDAHKYWKVMQRADDAHKTCRDQMTHLLIRNEWSRWRTFWSDTLGSNYAHSDPACEYQIAHIDHISKDQRTCREPMMYIMIRHAGSRCGTFLSEMQGADGANSYQTCREQMAHILIRYAGSRWRTFLSDI
jgi:hypothetical protein